MALRTAEKCLALTNSGRTPTKSRKLNKWKKYFQFLHSSRSDVTSLPLCFLKYIFYSQQKASDSFLQSLHIHTCLPGLAAPSPFHPASLGMISPNRREQILFALICSTGLYVHMFQGLWCWLLTKAAVDSKAAVPRGHLLALLHLHSTPAVFPNGEWQTHTLGLHRHSPTQQGFWAQ